MAFINRTATPPNPPTANIEAYIRKNGGPSRDWYVGIAADPKRRLFIDHQVRRQGGAWIYQSAGSAQDARLGEKYLLSLGCDGGDGGGDHTTRYLYAYRKGPHTRE